MEAAGCASFDMSMNKNGDPFIAVVISIFRKNNFVQRIYYAKRIRVSIKQSVAVRKILDISSTLNIIFLARFSDIV